MDASESVRDNWLDHLPRAANAHGPNAEANKKGIGAMRLRMPGFKLSRRACKLFVGIVLTLFVLAVLATWLVPKATRNLLTHNVSEMLGRQVQVGQIRFNPFSLALRAQDISVGKPQSAPLLQVGEVDLRVAWRSLVMFAPVIDRLHIEKPRLSLVRTDATHFNFSDIVERLARMSANEPDKPASTSTAPPRFSLNNLTLANGVIGLDDRVTGRKQTIDDLTLGIPFISSFGYATHIDVLPAVRMRINGSPFNLTGKALPFDTVPTSTLNVTLNGLALGKWADFWPMPLPIKVKSALLDSRLQVLFEQPSGAAPRIRIQGSLGLRKLDVVESSGAPLLAWDSLRVDHIAADLAARTVSIGAVTLEKPQVEVHRDARQLNWQRVANGFAKLGGTAPAKAAPAKPARPASMAPVHETAGKPSAPQAKPSSTPVEPVPAGAAPKAWKVAIDTFKLDAGQLRVRDDPLGLDYPMDGLSAQVEHITFPQAAGQPMQVRLNMDNSHDGSSLRVEAPVVLQPLSIHGQVQLNKLALAPFATALRHFAPMTLQGGRLNIEGKVDVTASHVEAHDVKLGLQQLAVRDDAVKPAVDLSVGALALTADRLALDTKPTSFTVKADGIQKHGTLALKGSLTVRPLSLKTRVDLANFDAASLAPYIASSLNATVRSVSLNARGDAEFASTQGHKPMHADWRGAIQVDHLDLLDRVDKAKFLSWKRLSLGDMHISMAGTKLGLGLGDIVLEDFYGNILLNNKAHLNVMDLMVDKGRAAGSITQDTQTRRSTDHAPRHSGAKPDISIHSVTLKRGRMLFNDHFVRPNYRAELSSINGTLSAVSSVKPTPARVKVTGRVYGTAPLSVSGTVQPFSRFLALNLKASAKGVDLPRFTTYSSKYVGYAIERGKLSVDLHYQIKNRALQASNRVQLNQLTFGKRSNSPDALKLPVLLAVALLKDSNGNIDINLPISGSLDDPQFSVAGIIGQVVVNTLAKVVTAPFKFLASAFGGGGGGGDLSYIGFASGSSTLDDKAKSSLATLAKVAASHGKRPDARDIKLTDADRAKYLEKVYGNAKIKNKPRNAFGFTKSLPPGQTKALLLADAPLGKQSLNALAEARARAVYEQITANSQDLADRVFIVAPKLDASGISDGGPATRVDFALH